MRHDEEARIRMLNERKEALAARNRRLHAASEDARIELMAERARFEQARLNRRAAIQDQGTRPGR
jgi:hypothetical protein